MVCHIFTGVIRGGISRSQVQKKNKKILEDYLQVTGLKKIKKFKKSLQQHRFILQCNSSNNQIVIKQVF